MATCNGAATLGAQLDSFAGQSLTPGHLVISDDGSSDATDQITRDFARDAGFAVIRLSGPRQGPAANFLHLIDNAPDDADFAAFSDQDDVWLPEKLARGVDALTAHTGPAMVCARAIIAPANLDGGRAAPMPDRAPGFRNALVQNIAGGNAMMVNRAALDLLRDCVRDAAGIVFHDWWIYQMVTGAGGAVLLDDVPTLLYRQHRDNAVGSGHRLRGFIQRPLRVISGRYAAVNETQIAALTRSVARLTPENRVLLARFIAARDGSAKGRLNAIRDLGLYRQGRTGNVGLWAAALLGRF